MKTDFCKSYQEEQDPMVKDTGTGEIRLNQTWWSRILEKYGWSKADAQGYWRNTVETNLADGPGYWRNTVETNLADGSGYWRNTVEANLADGPGYWRNTVEANLMVQDAGERQL